MTSKTVRDKRSFGNSLFFIGRRFFSLLFFLSSLPTLEAEETIFLHGDQSVYPIGNKCEYLVDADCRLTIDDVSTGAASSYFLPHRSENMSFGYTGAAVWLRFRVDNVTPQSHWVMKVDAFDDIRIYFPETASGYTEHRTGLKAPQADTVRRYGYYMIPLPAVDSARSIYLRFRHKDTMNLHVALLNTKGILRGNGEDIFIGVIFGILAVMIVYNFLLFVGLKDTSYLYYSLYILNMLMAQMVFAGIFLDLFPHESPIDSFTIETIVFALAIAFYVQFVRHFLMIKSTSPLLNKFMAAIICISCAAAPSAFFLPYLIRTYGMYILLGFVVCFQMFPIIHSIRRRYRPVRFYLFAFLILVASISLFVLRNFSILPNLFISEWGMQIGSCAEAVILALGLAYRINLLRTEKNIAVAWGRSNLEKAERMENDYRMLFDTAPVGIALFTLEGKYLAVNRSYCRMYERSDEELIGHYFFNLVYPEARGNVERAYWDALMAGPRTGVATFERTNITRTGRRLSVRYFLNFTSPSAGASEGVLCCVEDITVLRSALDNLRTSVREKELLLKELHHRVKNNLQIIISLFRLKSREFHDPRLQSVCEATEGRIRAIANVHNRMYLSKDVAHVDSETFIPSSVKQALSVSRLPEEQCSIVYYIDQAKLSVDIALPLSLIINELITNAVVHGYDGKNVLVIEVRFRAHTAAEEDGRLLLEIENSGKGFPEDVPRMHFESFGLNLVETLANQLGGTVTVTTRPRTCVAISFRGRER